LGKHDRSSEGEGGRAASDTDIDGVLSGRVDVRRDGPVVDVADFLRNLPAKSLGWSFVGFLVIRGGVQRAAKEGKEGLEAGYSDPPHWGSQMYALLGVQVSMEGTRRWAQRGHPKETKGHAWEENRKCPKETLWDREVEARSGMLS
jgi:hypothetical protein